LRPVPEGRYGKPALSGFAQAVASQALARTGVMLREPLLGAAAAASFRGLRRTLLIQLAGGSWIREYSFTQQVILNAQLQSIISLESYATIARSDAARRVASDLIIATRRLLLRFEMGCWARYQLGAPAASLRYQTYHVELLRQLAATHAEPIWRTTYERWRRWLPLHAPRRQRAGVSSQSGKEMPCPQLFSTCPCRSTDSSRGPMRAWTMASATAGTACTSGP
jgi:D-glucuronyl C5-epimerase C-terminus